MTTTNDLLEAVLQDLTLLHDWANSDAEHSEESNAPHQAGLDRNRAMTLLKAIKLVRSARK